jgi:hypothetical protein
MNIYTYLNAYFSGSDNKVETQVLWIPLTSAPGSSTTLIYSSPNSDFILEDFHHYSKGEKETIWAGKSV